MTHTSVKVLKWIKVNAANPFFHINSRGIILIISNRSLLLSHCENHSPNTPILQFPSTSNQNYSNMFYSNVLFRLKNGLIEKRKTCCDYHKRNELNETKRICASRCRNILFRLDLLLILLNLLFFSLEYEPLEVLGKGISSIVRKCVNRTTGDHYAVKVIDLLCDEAPTRDEVQNEVYIINFIQSIYVLTSTVYSD